VGVDPSDAAARESVPFDELQNFGMLCGVGLRQLREEPEDLGAPSQVAERQFADHERVKENEPVLEEGREPGVSTPQVIDPEGRVDQDQRLALGLRTGAGRRRRGSRRPFSVPPSAASRRALSRAMSASRPAWTIAVFSVRPVRLLAFARRESSRISVVLICISMVILYASVKRRRARLALIPHALDAVSVERFVRAEEA
jgi:hypothetical protein